VIERHANRRRQPGHCIVVPRCEYDPPVRRGRKRKPFGGDAELRKQVNEQFRAARKGET